MLVSNEKSGRVETSSVDLKIHDTLNAVVAAATAAFAVKISDRILQSRCDGEKLLVVD